MNGRTWSIAGAVLGGLAVALGAFGAHGLEDYLAASNQTATYETAVRYQMYHALALLLVGAIAERTKNTALTVAGCCFVAGTIIFSGALYGIALAEIRRLGMIAPLGGALLIVGWAALVVAALGHRTNEGQD